MHIIAIRSYRKDMKKEMEIFNLTDFIKELCK